MKINKKIIASVGLIGVLAVGGTFAYYNQTLSLDNPLSTGHYENQMIEEYTPSLDEIAPGATLNKDVAVVNTGDYPVMVRVKMDEAWTRAKKNDDGTASGVDDIIEHDSSENSGTDNIFAVDPTLKDGKFFIATQSYANSGDKTAETDGNTDGDWSVVAKMLSSTSSKWTFNAADGYWYYNTVLNAGDSTEDLLDSLVIATNIDLGLYNETDWYYIGDENTDKEKIPEKANGWVEYKITKDTAGKVLSMTVGTTTFKDRNGDGLVNALDLVDYLINEAQEMTKDDILYRRNESLLDKDSKGYADANYTLTVTSEVVQATSDAVKEVFGYSELPAAIQSVIDGLDSSASAQN